MVLSYFFTLGLAFLAGVVCMWWLSWRMIEALVRQDCEARGYAQARADASAERVAVLSGREPRGHLTSARR